MVTTNPHEEQKGEGQVSRLSSFLDSIFEINTKLVQGLDYQQILDSLFSNLRQFIPYDRLGVALLDQNGKRISLKWVRSMLPVNFVPGKGSTFWFTIPLKRGDMH